MRSGRERSAIAVSRSAPLIGGSSAVDVGGRSGALCRLDRQQDLSELRGQLVPVGPELCGGRLDEAGALAGGVEVEDIDVEPLAHGHHHVHPEDPGVGAFPMWRTRQRCGPISTASSSWAAAVAGVAVGGWGAGVTARREERRRLRKERLARRSRRRVTGPGTRCHDVTLPRSDPVADVTLDDCDVTLAAGNVTLAVPDVTLAHPVDAMTCRGRPRPHPQGSAHQATEGVAWAWRRLPRRSRRTQGKDDPEALDAGGHQLDSERGCRLVAGCIVVVGEEDAGHPVAGEGLRVGGGEAGGAVGGGDVLEAAP